MASDICRFAEFELDRSAYQLRRKGRPVQLERIPLDVLFILADRRGQLVTREEILERVWGKNVFLDTDNAINTAVRKIRHALHDDSESPRFVATVPAKGYRFVAPVRAANTARSEPSRVRLPQNSLVGREREMATLRAGLDDATSGRGRLFLISGEPGIGKTRLADELAVLADAKGMRLLVGHCSERDEAVAYLPFVEILENFIARASTPEALRTALGEQGPELARLLPRLENILPGLPPPLDLPPAQARRQLFNCYRDFIARVAREQPLLLVLEDLHWSADSTLSLLDHLMQRLSDLPLLLVGTYRDAGLNVTGGLAKTLEDLLRRRLATQVRLKGLPRDEVAAMLKSLSGKSPPDAVVSQIYAETEGNPFFVEELFRHLEEENRLYDSAGQFRSELGLGELEAPPSVRLVVARRLARLTDLTQKMLATAAVIGRVFSFEILQGASAANEDSILKCIEEAEKAGLLFSVAESPKARFEFSHELVRQAVIGGLSAARRQRLHLEVADAIERTYSAALEDYCTELAHHYARSSNTEKTIEYLDRAGRQAIKLGALKEAELCLKQAIAALSTTPETPERTTREFNLRFALWQVLAGTRGFTTDETVRAARRLRELGEKTGNPEQLTNALRAAWAAAYLQGELTAAQQVAEQLMEIAERSGSRYGLTLAHSTLGLIFAFRGELTRAMQHSAAAIASYNESDWSGDVWNPHVDSLSSMGLVLWNLGSGDQGRAKIREAISLSERLKSPACITASLGNASRFYMNLREPGNVREAAERLSTLASEQQLPQYVAQGSVYRGWAMAEQGRTDEGIALIRAGLDSLATLGTRLPLTASFIALSEAQTRAGQIEEAFAAIKQAFSAVGEVQIFLPAVLWQRGELHLKRGDETKAAGDFREAIGVARRMGSKAFELRATTSLARMLNKQGKRDEARAMLAGIYNQFTEGFDTADLKDAKAILDQLNA
jgi:DNA-binding winged helix-turn-helix (wHTH) protein/tetratricopeptide (TPR) repeat protein